MDYAEFEVPPSLRRHVQCVWRLRDAASARAQTIYPDGRCELIVHLGEPMRLYTLADGWKPQARCLFAAQLRSAIRLAAAGPVDCVGVRLQPAASFVIAQERLPGLTDSIIDMDQLDPGFAAQLTVVAQGADTVPERMWRLLESRIGSCPLDSQIESAVAAADAGQGNMTVAALARARSMSLRGLQVRFLRGVGLTPKEYVRVQRLQATLRHLDRDSASLSQLAVEAGFADQAHATREVRHFTGLTPSRLRRALQAEREGDETLRMAAAFVRGQARPFAVAKNPGSV